MNPKPYVFILIFLFFHISTARLAYVANVMRHGARYPTSDIYDGKQTAAFRGQLTTVGMRQQYLLGTYLRADYIDKLKFLNSTLYPKQVEVFTDSSERCVESAICHLMGFFPFGSGSTIPDGISQDMLDPPFESSIKQSLRRQIEEQLAAQFGLEKGFQPVPYKNSSLFFPDCPNEGVIFSQRLEKVAAQLARFQLQQAAFTDKMRLIFNLTAEQSNVGTLTKLYDVVTCDKYLGRDLPQNFTNDDYQQLKFIQQYLFVLTYGGEPSKIYSTLPVAKILANMDNSIKNGKNQVIKYSLFSEHDADVTPLLTFFDLTTPQCLEKKWKNQTVQGNCVEPPPFAASLIFELHQDDSTQEYTVKIRYNGVYYNVCDGKQECPYKEFAEKARSKFVDTVKECGIKSEIQQEIVEE